MSNKEQEMKARDRDMSDASQEVVVETTEAAAEGVVTGYKKIENGVVSGYKKIENGVVEGYKKLENGIVAGFNKVTDKCVQVLFAKDGESVEDAKARLSGKDKE